MRWNNTIGTNDLNGHERKFAKFQFKWTQAIGFLAVILLRILSLQHNNKKKTIVQRENMWNCQRNAAIFTIYLLFGFFERSFETVGNTANAKKCIQSWSEKWDGWNLLICLKKIKQKWFICWNMKLFFIFLFINWVHNKFLCVAECSVHWIESAWSWLMSQWINCQMSLVISRHEHITSRQTGKSSHLWRILFITHSCCHYFSLFQAISQFVRMASNLLQSQWSVYN